MQPAQSAPPVSPLARRVIAERNLDLGRITGTGSGGRITREDALRAAAALPAAAVAPQIAGVAPQIAGVAPQIAGVAPQIAGVAPQEGAPLEASTPPVAALVSPRYGVDARETREPMSRLRRALAARLVQARQQTALTTTFNEADMGAVQELRRRYGEDFEKRHGVRLGLMSFFVKAACRALEALPVVNSRIEGEEIVTCRYFDIGVAVSTERGLVVPVLRDADTLSFAEIEKKLLELAQRARERRISPEELSGGTFTITNGGVFGSLLSAPLPNHPQAAILGMHAIQRRPVAREEQVVIRPMMYLALSYDHRLIDGREAVQFLVKVKQLVEEPERLLLEQ
jgi:2-oxoglutarate dehydrogenase E2 component (dihydrolipoamide succinyltransferase)